MTFYRNVLLLAVGLLAVQRLSAQSQLPDLPSAPGAAPAKSANPFALPPATARSLPEKPQAPDPEQKMVCDAPATGIYAGQPKMTPAQQNAVADYTNTVWQSIANTWYHRMPRSAGNQWFHPKPVQIRLAIMPDGSYDTPIVTISSGHTDWDYHAVQAITSYEKFPPLPEGIHHPVPFCFHFNYDTDGSMHPSPKTPDLWPPPQKPKS